MKKIGERIKIIRKELGLTQEEFGSQSGVKGNTVTGYERGTRAPSEAIINMICLIFKVEQTWLRTGEGDEPFLHEPDFMNALDRLYSDYDCNALEKKFLSAYFSLKRQERYAFCSKLKDMFPALPKLIGEDPLTPTWLPTHDSNESAIETPIKKKKTILGINPEGLSDEEFGSQIRNAMKLEEKAKGKLGA